MTDAIRGVLRLVEHAAGGPAASAKIALDGIALANSPAGHGANTYQAHIDDDPIFRAALAKVAPRRQADYVRSLGEEVLAEATTTKANVVADWINVGPESSGALLSRAGVVIPGYNDAVGEADLAQVVRVLRHEAQHVGDPTIPDLSTGGARALREALAEAHSGSLPHLAPARSLLGLDGMVGDAALAQAARFRPYAEVDGALVGALQHAGIDPSSAEAGALLARPARQVAEELVTRTARADGSDAGAVREGLSERFEHALDRAHALDRHG